jgi:transposase
MNTGVRREAKTFCHPILSMVPEELVVALEAPAPLQGPVTPFRRFLHATDPGQGVSERSTGRSNMEKSTTRASKKLFEEQQKGMNIVNPNAAGIDIGSGTHYVAVPVDRDKQPVRSFGCFTIDLYRLADWLKQCGIKTVAMESTGVYWIPLFQILETRGFDVKLVNARHAKNVPGRKTDVQDCRWLQELHSFGLLSGSFRPDDQICVLRSYMRQRDNLLRSVSSHVQRMQKALVQMNLQLPKVISDITGTTGMRIIRAIVEGERNPEVLAKMKHPQIERCEEVIAEALRGDYRDEHLFVLEQELALYDAYQDKIAACEKRIEAYLSTFEAKVDIMEKPLPAPEKNKRSPNHPLRHCLYQISGVDFTRVPGINVITAQTIISEVGLDMSKWPTEKHFASWLGLCPNNRITGGRIISSHTRPVVNRAADAFRLAAQSLSHSKSALGAYYRRMRSRLGAPEAITAAAHKLARIFYRLLKYGQQFVEAGLAMYEKNYKEHIIKNLKKRAKEFGYQLVENQPIPI